jgi:predicted DNA-binding protein (MmcQ/YjbR family)
MPKPDPLARAEAALREYALRFPEATEEFPWGERAIKVRGKVFVFLSRHDGNLSVTTKLPQSGPVALGLPFASPTGYGLGKSGWVTARFDADTEVPVWMLEGWIDESYRAVAPKKLVAGLDANDALPAEPMKAARRKKKPAE